MAMQDWSVIGLFLLFPMGRKRTPVWAICFSSVKICLHCGLLFWFILREESRVEFLVRPVLPICTLLELAMLLSHEAACYRKKEILLSVLEIAENLQSVNPAPKSKWMTIYTLLAVLSYLAVIFYNLRGPSPRMFMICAELNCIVSWTILMQFLYYVDMMRGNLVSLANDLDPIEPILSLQIELHDRLIDTCKKINEFYSDQLLFGVSRIFMISVMTFLKLTDSFSDNLVLSCLIAPRHLMMVVLLADICSSTKKEADRFCPALFKLITNNIELCDNKIVSLYLTVKPTINFTAHGFFPLGNNIISCIITVTITYGYALVELLNPGKPAPILVNSNA